MEICNVKNKHESETRLWKKDLEQNLKYESESESEK